MSVDARERRARAALTWIVEPETRGVADMVDRDGPAHLRAGDFRRSRALAEELAAALHARSERCRPDDDLRRIDRLGGRFVCPGDEEWPERLGDLSHAGSHPPFGLWVRGPATLADLTDRSVAVVGSRAASAYGEYVAGELGAGLGTRGWTVVSGGAYGIDACAHRGALAVGGPTVVVLACGVDVTYPRGHQSLFDRVAQEHLLVSESAPGCAPHRARFLVRNRIIAALTRGTVVVEAAPRSGALSTAGRAAHLYRPLMAVPGAVTSTLSAGCHLWIRDRGAVLVCDADQVLEQVAPIGEHLAAVPRGPERVADGLPPFVRAVLEGVPVLRPAGPGPIAVTAGIDESNVRAALRSLRALGLVEHVKGGWRLVPARADDGGRRDARDAPQEVLDLGL